MRRFAGTVRVRVAENRQSLLLLLALNLEDDAVLVVVRHAGGNVRLGELVLERLDVGLRARAAAMDDDPLRS